MATKIGRVVTYLLNMILPFKIPLSDKLLDALVRWSCKITWKFKTNISSLSQCTWPTNLAGWWLTRRSSFPLSHSHLVLRDHETNQNYYISVITMPKASKLSRMVTYLEELSPIKSYDHLVTWSCETTWQTKSIISPLPHCLLPPNVVGWWLSYKLKPLLIQYHSAYSHQTWQGGDLPWGVVTHKVTWSFIHVILQDHVTKLKTYLRYHNAYGNQTWKGGDMQYRTLTRKVTWSFSRVISWGHMIN